MDATKSADASRRNNVHIVEEGPETLFTLGFGCDQRMWRHVAPAFAGDHRVVPSGSWSPLPPRSAR